MTSSPSLPVGGGGVGGGVEVEEDWGASSGGGGVGGGVEGKEEEECSKGVFQEMPASSTD